VGDHLTRQRVLVGEFVHGRQESGHLRRPHPDQSLPGDARGALSPAGPELQVAAEDQVHREAPQCHQLGVADRQPVQVPADIEPLAQGVVVELFLEDLPHAQQSVGLRRGQRRPVDAGAVGREFPALPGVRVCPGHCRETPERPVDGGAVVDADHDPGLVDLDRRDPEQRRLRVRAARASVQLDGAGRDITLPQHIRLPLFCSREARH